MVVLSAAIFSPFIFFFFLFILWPFQVLSLPLIFVSFSIPNRSFFLITKIFLKLDKLPPFNIFCVGWMLKIVSNRTKQNNVCTVRYSVRTPRPCCVYCMCGREGHLLNM
jgi:hypothetical protein